MTIWLVVYYEFYNKRVSSNKYFIHHVVIGTVFPLLLPSIQIFSPKLCDVIKGELSSYIQEEGYICLIQCFLDPKLMLKCLEPPYPLTGNKVLKITPDFRSHPVPKEMKEEDPLHKLFFLSKMFNTEGTTKVMCELIIYLDLLL